MPGPETISLRDGNAMPQLGFGVWQIPNEDTPRLAGEALRLGYRSIDTAQGYGNEQGVGIAIRDSGIPRSDIFITSKLRNGGHARDLALEAFDKTMDNLGIDTIDLFLIHWPVPAQDKYVEAWKTLVELQQQGRIKSVGVSNFTPEQIDRIVAETGVVPVVNQIELHPRYQQRDMRSYLRRHNIQIESWSPLGPAQGGAAFWSQYPGKGGGASLLDDPTITAIAEKYGKTPAQVILRWHLDEGLALFPRSTKPERIAENFAVFDFTLDPEDRYRIEALDDPKGRIGGDPADWNRIF